LNDINHGKNVYYLILGMLRVCVVVAKGIEKCMVYLMGIQEVRLEKGGI
jgi:hypothetical protein